MILLWASTHLNPALQLTAAATRSFTHTRRSTGRYSRRPCYQCRRGTARSTPVRSHCSSRSTSRGWAGTGRCPPSLWSRSDTDWPALATRSRRFVDCTWRPSTPPSPTCSLVTNADPISNSALVCCPPGRCTAGYVFCCCFVFIYFLHAVPWQNRQHLISSATSSSNSTDFSSSSSSISYDLRQTIITRIISKSTCPIFAKFSGLVELWFRWSC